LNVPEKDPILREQYYIINNLWKSAMNIRKIHNRNHLKEWSYQFSTNVCHKGLMTDLIGVGFLLIVLSAVM